MMFYSMSQGQALAINQNAVSFELVLLMSQQAVRVSLMFIPTWLKDFFWPRRWRNAESLAKLHAKIVAQVREPGFYRDFGVADNFDGRFDLLVLHAGFLVRALSLAPQPCPDIASDVMSLVIAGLDADLREMGVGDVSMPKKIKPMVEAFYGRMKTYSDALQNHDDLALAKALLRNVYAVKEGAAHEDEACFSSKSTALARYVRAMADSFEAMPVVSLHEDIFNKEVLFPAINLYLPKKS